MVGRAEDDPARLNDPPVGGNEFEREVASRDRFSTPVRIRTPLSELEDLSNRPPHPAERLADNRLQQVTEVLEIEHFRLSVGYRMPMLLLVAWPSRPSA